MDAADTRLHVANSVFSEAATALVLTHPKLTQTVIGQLENKQYIKLCGDGTFRLIRQGWALITVGVLTKKYDAVDKRRAFATTFNPLAYAIANTESEATYSAVL